MNEIQQDDQSRSPSEKSSPPVEHRAIEAGATQLNVQISEPKKCDPKSPGSSTADRDSESVNHKGAMITVEYKHSLATRWMHWLNFPLLFLMIYSGILIYWADSQQKLKLPSSSCSAGLSC
jgi:hypothetical protein